MLNLLIICVLTLVYCFIEFYSEYGYLLKIGVSVDIIIATLLFFLPIGKTSKMSSVAPNQRVDERNNMFSRNELIEDSDHYKEYYGSHPENKIIDDTIRELPELLCDGGEYYDEKRSGIVKAMFAFEKMQIDKVDGEVADEKQNILPDEATEIIKRHAKLLGADKVGISELDPMYVYSHNGRDFDQYGSEIKNDHKYVIVFTVEMNHAKVEEAPNIGMTEETAMQYLHAQRIAICLAQYIRQLGYPARAQISGSNYQIMLPPVAQDAGLGEMGRCGFIIADKHGSRVRLGAVTTDLPLSLDKPISLGVQEFCEICKKCAVNCPSGSIPIGEKENVRGVDKWQVNVESCYKYWRHIGTDCGLCMKVCPYSHPNTIIHNIIRIGIKRSAVARWMTKWGDELFYGKKII